MKRRPKPRMVPEKQNESGNGSDQEITETIMNYEL